MSNVFDDFLKEIDLDLENDYHPNEVTQEISYEEIRKYNEKYCDCLGEDQERVKSIANGNEFFYCKKCKKEIL